MAGSTSPIENAPGGESPEALDAGFPSDQTKEKAMIHHTVKQSQAQLFALVRARSDAAFQRLMSTALSAKPNQGRRFDRATVEGFRHA